MENRKIEKKKTIGIYQSHLSQIGGVETFLYNWCWWLRNYFDVTVIYCSGDYERLKKMSKIVKMIQYNSQEKFEFDIVIRNSVWGEICNKIYSKENRYIEIRHANYKYLLDNGWLYQQYHKWDRTNEIIGCGEFVSKMSHEALGDNPTTIKNILLPKKETNKVLKLISCTRLDAQKGWNRMVKMMDMMRANDIKFEWNIFTNSKAPTHNYEEVHFWKQRYDIWDYLASADYTVLLSDSEGLPYTVQESLQYQVPCIVTDVGGCTELIKDGINGYVVPLDMNFDINKIRKIPKCPEYDNGALEKWLEYLEYDGKKIDVKEILKRMEEEKEIMVKVRALKGFEKIRDAERNVYPKEGEEWTCSKERAEYLVEHGVVEIVEEIKEKPKKVETKVEPIKEAKPKATKKKPSKK